MNFGDKLRTLREQAHLTQGQLAEQLGVSERTIQNWENENRSPRNKSYYNTIAKVLGCDLSYLIDDDAFLLKAEQDFGPRGRKEAKELLREVSAWFSGGEISENDMEEFMFGVQEAYVIAKKKNRKYVSKKKPGG